MRETPALRRLLLLRARAWARQSSPAAGAAAVAPAPRQRALFSSSGSNGSSNGSTSRRPIVTDSATAEQPPPAPPAVPCAAPPRRHPLTGRPVRAAVALSGGVDSAVAALLARERFGAGSVFCVWARTWDAGDEEGSGSGGSATASGCYGGVGSCSPSSSPSSPGAGAGASAGAGAAAAPSPPPPLSSAAASPPAPPPLTPSACEAEADLRSAQRVAASLGLPLVEADLRAHYWNRVFDGFLSDAAGGSATPNPDLGCNSAVKFGALLDFARAQRPGEEVVLVTGHYARVGVDVADAAAAAAGDEGGGAGAADEEGGGVWPPSPSSPPSSSPSSPSSPSPSLPAHPLATPSRARLLRGVDLAKDQSYFLSTLSSEQLARSWFPIGEAPSKAAVRAAAVAAAAAAAGGSGGALAAVSTRRSSAGICFVGRRRRFSDFLEGYLEPVPGRFACCETSADLGPCANLLAVTHGQRAPLEGGAAAAARRQQGATGKAEEKSGGSHDGGHDDDNPRWYVVGKDMARRVAHVAAGREHPALLTRAVLLEAPRWVAGAAAAGSDGQDQQQWQVLPFAPGTLLQYKARYRQDSPGWCTVRLATPQEAAERAGGAGGGEGGAGRRPPFRASRFFRRRDGSGSGSGSGCGSSSSSSSGPASSSCDSHQPLLVAELSEPTYAATPGQALVLFRGDECVGGATIAAPGRTLFEERGE